MGDSSMAIKCINIIEVNFEIQFREVIKEYLFLAIASALGIAPKVVNIFGFDILLFRDAFVFTMEFCEIGKHRNGSKASLSHSLLLLHQLNIIHLDIKPDNIGFSFLHNEHILIDFGLTRMVK
jgi:serine/threonine protein kinase